jgi:formylglycine-generating enzyme required for sulfatase activity
MGKACCTPTFCRPETQQRRMRVADYPEFDSSMIAPSNASADMVRLPGGVFQMGTDTAEGFPLDGEGPFVL